MKKLHISIFLFLVIFILSACTNNVPVNEESNNETKNIEKNITLESGSYIVDKENSIVNWTGRRIASSHSGTVKIKSGKINIVENNNLENSSIIIDMSSIKDNDGSERLEEHLKSEDFFAVSNYPESEIFLKEIKNISGDNYQIISDLTIKEITKEITFPAKIIVSNGILEAEASFEIDRSEFEIKYGSNSFFSDLGDKAIKNEIEFKINLFAGKD